MSGEGRVFRLVHDRRSSEEDAWINSVSFSCQAILRNTASLGTTPKRIQVHDQNQFNESSSTHHWVDLHKLGFIRGLDIQ